MRVLEDKDISVTVALLDQLTSAQITAHCSALERLCITQQLAADMSVNIPIEVNGIIEYNVFNFIIFIIFIFYYVGYWQAYWLDQAFGNVSPS